MIPHVTLASGSGGNAILVGRRHDLLVEAGIPPRTLAQRVHEAGASLDGVRAILLSHEHGDHARYAARVAQQMQVPVFGSEGTLDALPRGDYERVALRAGERRQVAGYDVTPLAVSHDAAEPFAFRVEQGTDAWAYLTDTGHAAPSLERELRDVDAIVVESNHDADLLENGLYPGHLKRRIAGHRGHLSNEACARFLRQTLTERTRVVTLHHLSKINNTPELALATVHSLLSRSGVEVPALAVAPPSACLNSVSPTPLA